ncbi:MAG: hypothetical protein DRI34_12020 [Deltaproteobacteria bacterium]|nr:MAG: hypothetical protein DRI34_12020 [Deltaproteobacteria bacterium]
MVSGLADRSSRYVLLLLSSMAFSCSPGGSSGENVFTSDRFLNIAHRGGALLAPEETMVAYENAVAAGADVLEMDLHETADGVIVCMHDEKIDRTTDGEGFIRNFTYEELSRFDAGYNFSPPDFPCRGRGLIVPRFVDILDAFTDMSFMAEIKQVDPPIIDDVLEVIRERGLYERIIIASLVDSVVERVKEKDPRVMTSWGTTEMLTFVTMSDEDEKTFLPSSRFLQPPREVISEETMERIRRFALKVHVWTVNEPADMRRFMGMGVDGIITDDPETLEVLASSRFSRY